MKTSAPRQLGVVRLTGVVDARTLLRSMDALARGETWVPTFNTIWDCRPVTGITVDHGELPPLLARMRALNRRLGSGRTAVVASDTVVSAFVHMLFARDACPFREWLLFETLDAALRWIVEMYPARAKPRVGPLPIAPI